MRISTSLIFQNSLSNISNAQSRWLRAGLELSTGKKIINPSDNPLAASQALRVNQSEGENSQYKAARSYAEQNLSISERQMAEVTNTIQSIQQLNVRAGNASLSDNDRAALLTELEGLKEQLVGLANAKDGMGRYLFSGFKTDVPPFEVDAAGNVTYVGGDTAMTQKIDAARTIPVSFIGSDIFMRLTSNPSPEPDGSPSEANIFETIKQLEDALKVPLDGADQLTTDAYREAVDKANRGLRNSSENVSSYQARAGIALQELETLNNIGAEKTLSNQLRLSDLLDVDFVEASSRHELAYATVYASYMTFNKLQGMNLFQLR